MSDIEKPTSPEMIAALENVEKAARRFRNAACLAVATLKARGEVEYCNAGPGLDGALQVVANLRGQGRYFPGVEPDDLQPIPKTSKRRRKAAEKGSVES